MTIRIHVHTALAVLAIGCSQGNSWEPPENWDTDEARGDLADQGEPLDTATFQTEVVMPFDGQSCSRIGEVVNLGASVTSSLPVHVIWTFQSEHAGCDPVILGEPDSSSAHSDEYSMYTWNTSCALDVPNDCGYGQGFIGIEVIDVNGVSAVDNVPFCLEPPRGVELAQAP